MVSVEREQFENGITRILGLTKVQVVIGVTLIRCLAFVVPAIIISLLLGEMILYKIQKALYLDEDGI